MREAEGVDHELEEMLGYSAAPESPGTQPDVRLVPHCRLQQSLHMV